MPLEELIATVFCRVETAFEDVTAGIELRTCEFATRLSDYPQNLWITLAPEGRAVNRDAGLRRCAESGRPPVAPRCFGAARYRPSTRNR